MPPEPAAGLDLDVAAPNAIGRDEARTLLQRVVDRAGVPGGSLAVYVSDDLVRHEARRAGFTGPLRGPMSRTGLLRVGEEIGAVSAADVDALAAQLGAFLAPTTVERRRGFTRGYDLRATTPQRDRLSVRVPRDTEVMAEPIAAALDTAFAIKARFGRAATGINAFSFDHGGELLEHGAISGVAEGGAGVVVLSPTFAGVEFLVDERRARLAAGFPGRPAPARARPYLRIDDVVAHECGHYLAAEIRVSGSAYVDFNAQLGAALGVDSLELALRGREPNAPADWRAGYRRLVDDVSAYAGTSPREATAEMFGKWWCAPGPHPPVIERFAELVERYFPRPSIQ